MRLVDHVRDATGISVTLTRSTDDLIEDAEEIEGVLRTDDQVVIGIAAVVEVEAAQPTLIEQLCDNLRDIGPLGMVASIHQHLRLRAQFLGHEQ